MLSKTDFLFFLDAPMHLWARVHHQLRETVPSPIEQFRMEQGQKVEALAREFIENNLMERYANAQLLWQTPFDDGKFEIRTDALIWDKSADVYDLYEIKSSTKVQTDHEYDVTFQALLLEEILKLRQVAIIHINNEYQMGENLDLLDYFTITDVTEKIQKRRAQVSELREMALLVSKLSEPGMDLACKKPKTCPCPDLCHPDLPDHAVFQLPYIGKKAVDLREMGITAIKDIPDSYPLNDTQFKHVRSVKLNTPVVDCDAIERSIATLEYPLNFLDYETFNPAIPLFGGYHPYEHIVFQYSLFVVSAPGEEPEHFECLITGPQDPAPIFVSHLLKHLTVEGSVIVWNQSFEAQRNKELALHCPQYAERLLGINDRLYDLMRIFKDGHYVHPAFRGSASLKAVLPVICPELGYDDLAISNGEQAMLTWYQIQAGNILHDDLPQIEAQMKDYCRLDTFGMIAILEKLKELIGG
jgi:hypothetical protein